MSSSDFYSYPGYISKYSWTKFLVYYILYVKDRWGLLNLLVRIRTKFILRSIEPKQRNGMLIHFPINQINILQDLQVLLTMMIRLGYKFIQHYTLDKSKRHSFFKLFPLIPLY